MGRAIIDLGKRVEKRYILPSLDKVLDEISSFMEKKKFSDNEYVQTIYLNNKEHAVPFSTSVKVRRYLPEPSIPVLNEDDQYFLELKTGRGFVKDKIRVKGTLKEIIQLANEKFQFEILLRPYVVSTYHRQHFAPEHHDKVRITADDNTEYFFFEPHQKESVKIGEEDFSRIEVKTRDGGNSDQIDNILSDLRAFPAISKKIAAYNFLLKYLAKNYGGKLYNEFPEVEIEAKLIADSSDLFLKIKQFFIDGNSDEFELSPYPYTHETASINRYYKDEEGVTKALLRGNSASIVKKGSIEVMPNSFGLECILKRKETKERISSVWSPKMPSAPLAGELYRARKCFWVGNPKTRRMYNILLDRCQDIFNAPDDYLHQVEIEYTGREFESAIIDEAAVVHDIAALTNILLTNFPTLQPTQLTKEDWLGIKN